MAPSKIENVAEAVRAHALNRPEAIAIESSHGSLSYAELEARAERVAQALAAAGVGPGVRVALYGARCPELFAAVLGVVKAGGVYLCLDPEYPAARREQIWSDYKAKVLIADAELAASLPLAGATLLPLTGEVVGQGTPIAAGPMDPAYAIFTSGSTGRPKGILLHQQGLANLTQETLPLLQITPEDRFLQFAALSFDVSVWETWTALAAGATLVLPAAQGGLLAASLEKILAEHRISAAFIAPSMMAVMRPEKLPDLRRIISVGERLPRETAEAWAVGRRLINGYGPAEASVTVSAYVVDAGVALPAAGPPIGQALPGNTLSLLDENLQPVAEGAVGELCIGGLQVGLGYIDQPELTAEKFITDPQGNPLYRTGDLARRLPSGDLEFAGRRDAQLKVRGVRVEPGEIEAVLRAHKGVRDAVVVLQNATQRQRLAAFYVAADPTPTPEELRAWAAERLPKGLLPEVWQELEALPRTPNGKVDRRAALLQGEGI
jgi:nonribosomal peptide synthetase DhbF